MISKERILLGGVPGVGKTYAWATIARALPKHKFYVIDPDDGVRRVLYAKDDSGQRIFPDLKNIEYYFTPRWFHKGAIKVPSLDKMSDTEMHSYQTGVADAFRDIKSKAKEGDWIVIEHLGNLWSSVQDGFADEVFAKDIGQYFLEARKELKPNAKRLDALKGWTDWQVINKLHNDDFMVPACFELPCHVVMTTAVTMIAKGQDEESDIKAFYGEENVRFEGQKHNPFRAQTMMLLTANHKKNIFYFSTFLKDRGRKWVENVEWFDYFWQYLIGIAGFEE
jgi:hypothetical protein